MNNPSIPRRIFRFARYYLVRARGIRGLEAKLDFSTIDLVHTNNSVSDLGKFISSKHQIPHLWHLREGGFEQFNMKAYMLNWRSHMVYGTPDPTFVAISKSTKDAWVRLGLPAERIWVNYDGVKMPTATSLPASSTDEGFRFVMVGSVSTSKGQARIIEALAMLDEPLRSRIQLDFYGDITPISGEYMKKITSMLQEDNLSQNVNFCGYASNIWEVLPQYDCGINASVMEGFGRTTVEYLAAGLPVIAANSGASPEIICDEKKGLLFELDDISTLADAMAQMVERRAEYAATAQERMAYARQRFSDEVSVRKFMEKIISVNAETSVEEVYKLRNSDIILRTEQNRTEQNRTEQNVGL